MTGVALITSNMQLNYLNLLEAGEKRAGCSKVSSAISIPCLAEGLR
jgi:hypothetical protein